ncbi:MAG: hypothetical protein AAB667_02110 [Patescibacteria group bacterium]
MIPLREKEKVIRVVRRHWWQAGRSFIAPVLALILFFILRYSFKVTFFGYYWQVLLGLLVVGALYGLAGFYRWQRDALIITNQRLVRHEQRGLLDRVVTELLYSDVSDIAFKKRGLGAALGNHGTLIIRTLGDRKMLMDRVQRPEEVVEIINSVRLSQGKAPATDAISSYGQLA